MSAQPRDYRAVHDLVTSVADAVRRGEHPFGAAPWPEARDAGEPVSIVVCSNRPDRLAAMQANFRAHLGDRAHEFVVITDAKSLAEGYARAFARARHDLVVFSHDDIELVSPAPFAALAQSLRSHDIVGIAGSRLANGPAVTWAGHPHIHGWVAYPAPAGGFDASLFSLEAGELGAMQALDGLFFAARRAAVARVGFDAATFDGFHFYDYDFTLRAHRADLKLAVTTDVIAIHASAGSFDERWRQYAARFQAKFPELSAPKGDHHAYAARLADRAQVLAFYGQLRALGTTP